MKCEPSITGRALIVLPGEVEVLRRYTPDRRRVARLEVGYRAPDVGGWITIIDKERIEARASGQEIGSGAAIEDIGPAMYRDGIAPAAAMNEPVIRVRGDVQAI